MDGSSRPLEFRWNFRVETAAVFARTPASRPLHRAPAAGVCAQEHLHRDEHARHALPSSSTPALHCPELLPPSRLSPRQRPGRVLAQAPELRRQRSAWRHRRRSSGARAGDNLSCAAPPSPAPRRVLLRAHAARRVVRRSILRGHNRALGQNKEPVRRPRTARHKSRVAECAGQVAECAAQVAGRKSQSTLFAA